MNRHETEMKKLNYQILIQKCMQMRIKNRPWFNLDIQMLNTMIAMGNKMQNDKHFPQTLKPASQRTLVELELELANRN